MAWPARSSGCPDVCLQRSTFAEGVLMLREYMKQYKHELVTCERPLGGGVPISQIKVHCCSSLHAPTGPAAPRCRCENQLRPQSVNHNSNHNTRSGNLRREASAFGS